MALHVLMGDELAGREKGQKKSAKDRRFMDTAPE